MESLQYSDMSFARFFGRKFRTKSSANRLCNTYAIANSRQHMSAM